MVFEYITVQKDFEDNFAQKNRIKSISHPL